MISKILNQVKLSKGNIRVNIQKNEGEELNKILEKLAHYIYTKHDGYCENLATYMQDGNLWTMPSYSHNVTLTAVDCIGDFFGKEPLENGKGYYQEVELEKYVLKLKKHFINQVRKPVIPAWEIRVFEKNEYLFVSPPEFNRNYEAPLLEEDIPVYQEDPSEYEFLSRKLESLRTQATEALIDEDYDNYDFIDEQIKEIEQKINKIREEMWKEHSGENSLRSVCLQKTTILTFSGDFVIIEL